MLPDDTKMSLKEEIKTIWWPGVKKHGFRIVVGAGALGIAVSLFQGATVGQWMVYLFLSYMFGLPFTWKR